jgi:hypothetical protein
MRWSVLLACCALLCAGCGPDVDLTKALQVEVVSTGWFDAGIVNGQNKLVPTITFKLKNLSDQKLPAVQVNARFSRGSEPEEWGNGFLPSVGSGGLPAGGTTAHSPSNLNWATQAPTSRGPRCCRTRSSSTRGRTGGKVRRDAVEAAWPVSDRASADHALSAQKVASASAPSLAANNSTPATTAASSSRGRIPGRRPLSAAVPSPRGNCAPRGSRARGTESDSLRPRQEKQPLMSA